jgi:hypothetical protein
MTQNLRFYAKDNLIVSFPGSKDVPGNPARYVGRRYENADYPATQEGDSFKLGSPEFIRIKKLINTSPQPLYAADQETADAVGVPFVPVQFKDGKWQPKS